MRTEECVKYNRGKISSMFQKQINLVSLPLLLFI